MFHINKFYYNTPREKMGKKSNQCSMAPGKKAPHSKKKAPEQIAHRLEQQNKHNRAKKAKAPRVQAELQLLLCDDSVLTGDFEILLESDPNPDSVSAPALKCREKVRRNSSQALGRQTEKAESFYQVAKKCSRQCAKKMQASDLLEAIDGVTQDKLDKALAVCKNGDIISAILGPDVLPHLVITR